MTKIKQNSTFRNDRLIQKLAESNEMSSIITPQKKENAKYHIDDKIVHEVVGGGLKLYLAKLNSGKGNIKHHLSNNIDISRKVE